MDITGCAKGNIFRRAHVIQILFVAMPSTVFFPHVWDRRASSRHFRDIIKGLLHRRKAKRGGGRETSLFSLPLFTPRYVLSRGQEQAVVATVREKKKKEGRVLISALPPSTESNSKVGAVEYLETLFGDAPVRTEEQGRLRPAHFNYLRRKELAKVFFSFAHFFKTLSLRR